jgi:hypothetical protein
MKSKIIILFMVISTCALLFVEVSYAQFWRNWFQKGQHSEEAPMPGKSATETAQDSKQGFAKYEIEENTEADSVIDMDVQAFGEVDANAEQVAGVEADLYTTQEPVIPASTEIDTKLRAETLQRTQEQIDQIKKMQEINNIQRSIDSIKRINEMNQQHRRIDEINRLNMMQRNLDALRRMEETKK